MQDHFFIRSNGRYVKVILQEIQYIEGVKNYIRIVTEGKSYLVLYSLSKMEQFLPKGLFCRVHKSFIISYRHIVSFDSETVYYKDVLIPVGSTYRKEIVRRANVLQLEQDSKESFLSKNFKEGNKLVKCFN